MKVLLNLEWLNNKRAIFSYRFLFSSFLISLMLFATILPVINRENDVVSLLVLSLTGSHGNLKLILGTLPLLAFTTSFATEWEQKAVLPWIIRTGIYPYAISKVITSIISAILTTTTG